MNPLTNDLIIPHPLLLSSHCRCMESNQVWALWLGNKFVLQALKTVLKFIKRGDLQEKNCMHVLNLKWAKIYHWQTRASTFNTYKKLKIWYVTNVALFKIMSPIPKRIFLNEWVGGIYNKYLTWKVASLNKVLLRGYISVTFDILLSVFLCSHISSELWSEHRKKCHREVNIGIMFIIMGFYPLVKVYSL